MPGGPELLIVIIVVVVLFGASRLPAMGRNLGVGIKEFKKGIAEGSRNEPRDEASTPTSTDQREQDISP